MPYDVHTNKKYFITKVNESLLFRAEILLYYYIFSNIIKRYE